MLTRRQGRGTFLTDPAADGLADRFNAIRAPGGEIRAGTMEVAEIAQVGPGEDECARLRLDPGDLVWCLRRIRRDRVGAFMCERIALPAKLFSAGERRRLEPHRGAGTPLRPDAPEAPRRRAKRDPLAQRRRVGPKCLPPRALRGLS